MQRVACSSVPVRSWLARELVVSGSMYHSLLLEQNTSTELYVDNEENPKLACTIKSKSTSGEVLCCLYVEKDHRSVGAFSAIARKVQEVLEEMKKVQPDTSRCTFKALNSSHYENVISAMGNIGIEKQWQEPCGLFSLSKSSASIVQEQRVQLPSGYVQNNDMTTTGDHNTINVAQYVNDTWKYRSATSLPMIKAMLDSYPSVGIIHKETGKLVSWMLTYEDGAIGMLYVDEEHRRRGLARATVSLLLQKYFNDKNKCFCISEETIDCPCFTYIVDSNDASLGLFASLGFQRVIDCSWIGFK